MEETAAAPVLCEALLTRILRILVEMEEDAPAQPPSLCACACVNRAFAAAATSDALWRAALLRRWPAMLVCMAPAALPSGARLRDLFKRRHVADAAAAAAARAGHQRYSAAAAVPLEHRYRFELQLFKPHDAGGALLFSATYMLRATPEHQWAPPRDDDNGKLDDCNRIFTAARAAYDASHGGRYDLRWEQVC